MKRYLSTVLFVMLVASGLHAGSLNDFFKQADSFFSAYVHDGKVAYKEIKANSSGIEGLYNTIGIMDLSNASANEKKAFYINAYNLIVIYQVARYYPLKSPLDQSGFFDRVKHTVAGESITLNHLEIKNLLFAYKDPRLHFALACAAQSCPPLASGAYTPDNVDAKLTDRTTRALNDNNWLVVKTGEGKVELSKIFDWYKKDFTMNGQKPVLEFINTYREQKIPAGYTISYYEYDWSLNEG